MANVEKLSIALPLNTEELRRLVQEGIDSGPGLDANTVLARLRARYGQPPAQ